MRNYKILNRPMFNRNNSAYGRGIAANLVSEQERQRFNYGGRVRAAEGLWSSDWYKEPEMTWEGPPYVIPGLGHTAPQTDKEKLAIQKDIIKGGSPQDIFWAKELEEARLGKSDKYKTGEEGIGIIEKADIKIDEPANGDLPDDPDSDQLYTPQEQTEKKSQMMLALAERLVGGSRDKWGSKAQMENIAGGLKDIREIADPSERREMLAKYEAWGKARTKETLSSLREQERINSSEETMLNQHMDQPLSFKVSEILKIKNVERNTPFIVQNVPDRNRPGKEIKGRVIDKTKLEVGILYTDPADPNSFMVLDSQGNIQSLTSTTDIIEARNKKLIE